MRRMMSWKRGSERRKSQVLPIFRKAKLEGKSLNQLIAEKLERVS
jgi:predicted HicB family RNase H-like nuclease